MICIIIFSLQIYNFYLKLKKDRSFILIDPTYKQETIDISCDSFYTLKMYYYIGFIYKLKKHFNHTSSMKARHGHTQYEYTLP